MAKRKINAAMMLAAGENAHLQTKEKVSHANKIDGESFLEIELEKIENNPMQPRINLSEDELKELTRSIKLHGLIQPISVIEMGEGRYILKAGQRRLMAHKMLGKKKIKAIVQEKVHIPGGDNDRILFEIAVMENTQREQLDPLELALSLRHAMDKKLYKNMDELANSIGKSKSYISKVLKVLALQDSIIEDLRINRSTNDIETLYEIQKIKDRDEQLKIYRAFIDKKMDREAIRRYNKEKSSHAKHPYAFSKRGKKIKLELDTSMLEKEQVQSLEKEIDEILKKYFQKVES
jgi:ParB family chromosome partitioning protein